MASWPAAVIPLFKKPQAEGNALCKGRRGFPLAQKRGEDGGSGSVAYQDLDLIIFPPNLPCDLRQPALIFAEVLSVLCMHRKGQGSAPWQKGSMPTRSHWSCQDSMAPQEHGKEPWLEQSHRQRHLLSVTLPNQKTSHVASTRGLNSSSENT